MTAFRPVTLAHRFAAKLIDPGDCCVDATVGNGNDTVFLARRVGKAGRVLGFDVQKRAIASTQRKLRERGLDERVLLQLEGHENVGRRLKALGWSGIRIAMFNLGYLPGSDKRVVTRGDTTLSALGSCSEALLPRGAISIVGYRGHRGGGEEYDAVWHWASQLDSSRYMVMRYERGSATAPVFIWIEKKAQRHRSAQGRNQELGMRRHEG